MQAEFKNQSGDIYLIVTYDKENKWLYNRWFGFVTDEEIKKAADNFFQNQEKGLIKQILNDNTEQTGPWEKANDWLEQIWMPRAAKAGLEQFAHVIAPGIYSALSAQDMHRRTGPFFQMKIFGDIDKAQAWLKSFQ